MATAIANTTDPFWNTTFLINNPEGVPDLKGFIAIYLKDKNIIEDLMQTFLPLESMSPFVPYNLNISKKDVSNCNLMVSLVLEAKTTPSDKLYDILIGDILFEPIPKEITKIALAMTMS